MAEFAGGTALKLRGPRAFAESGRMGPGSEPGPSRGGTELHEGPDYVDDWMRRNIAPGVVEFVRSCCTSFVRWDLLRQLHGGESAATPQDLARAVGASRGDAVRELESLVSMGLVSRCRRRGHTIYRLEGASPLGRALEDALRAYSDSQEFRFALVYSIVKVSHAEVVLD